MEATEVYACGTCGFFAETNNAEGLGNCRRFPPTVIPNKAAAVPLCYFKLPVVHRTKDLCGEWRPKPPMKESL